MQIARFVALRYESASSLQKMAFLTAIYSFIFDITLFHVAFSPTQIVGLVLALLIYIVQLVFFVRESRMKKEIERRQSLKLIYDTEEKP